ncbi:unnamed protein product [Hermetia illucens]|uniref:Peptidase S1 domain-containing protein n=1 Tax=Hermetia illucens TaxID=343691 RepID=A0A7R8Z128_HERIL|nr:venom serine protease-like [Hermetia illucens]CAD7089371.1 unnamed protein product [Hermetia illucens]
MIANEVDYFKIRIIRRGSDDGALGKIHRRRYRGSTMNSDEDAELGCENELFIVSQEADPYFNNVEIFCGITTVHRQSLLQTITIGYISELKGGYFECEFRSIPQRCDCGWSSVSKIVGGHEAQLHEFPFMAGIVSFSLKRIICGGSIISDRFTLTAAHCVSNPSEANNIALVIGEHDVTTGKDTPYTKLHLIDRIIYHENYNNVSWENDIALVRVQEQMTWSIGVAPICLPFLDRFRNFANQQAEIAGWGTTEFGGVLSNTLMKGTVRILSNEYCQNQMDLCTYDDEVDSCQGDSGGPIILNRDRMFLVGIISFGKGCPGIGHNVRVTSYLDWIVTNTGQDFCMKPIGVGN